VSLLLSNDKTPFLEWTIPESVGDRLSDPSGFEAIVGQVGNLRIGGVEIGAVASRTSRLKDALAVLGLLCGEHAAPRRTLPGMLSMGERQSAERD
jgi:hypothetical protein